MVYCSQKIKTNHRIKAHRQSPKEAGAPSGPVPAESGVCVISQQQYVTTRTEYHQPGAHLSIDIQGFFLLEVGYVALSFQHHHPSQEVKLIAHDPRHPL